MTKRLLCENPSTRILHTKDSFQTLKEITRAEENIKKMGGWEEGEDGKFCDVVITDPPYSEHVQKNLCSGSLVGTKNVPKYELSFVPLSSYDFVLDLLRITRRWVLVFCSLEDFGRFEQVAGREQYVRGGVWYKPNAMGQLTADRPATSYEGIAILHAANCKKEWNGKGSFAIWKCNGTRGLKNRHPNEKPIDLCLKLVSLFSNPGETIFDPFCGSAAIGQAAFSLNRNYIGWDKDESWVKKSRLRLAEVELKNEKWARELCRMNA